MTAQLHQQDHYFRFGPVPRHKRHAPQFVSVERVLDNSNLIDKKLRAYLMADAAGQEDWCEFEAENFSSVRSGDALDDMHCRGGFYTGRIGMDILAPRNASVLAVIGSGIEAEMQICAALDTRKISALRLYAPKTVAVASLAKKFRNRLPQPIEICATPEEAVHRAEVVVLATGDRKPHIDADWVMPGVHITCALPQEVSRHELPIGLLSRAKIIASDSPQYIGENNKHLVDALNSRRRVIHLGAMIDRFNPDRARGTTILLISGAPSTNMALLNGGVGVPSHEQ